MEADPARTRDRFAGCLLGLALGDALGAPHEGGPLERTLWRLIGKTRAGEMRWTDDTQMALDVAESLVCCGRIDCDDLARRFAASYRWSRGYGRGAAKVLRRIARGAGWQAASRSVFAGGSYGNGGAMRAPVVGLFYAGRPDELGSAARASGSVTHAHPLGQEGALLVAVAVAAAATGASAERDPVAILSAVEGQARERPFVERLRVARTWLAAGAEPAEREVRRELGNGIAAHESCVTAIWSALRFLDRPFEDLQLALVRLGGDVDTIGAMAGAIWGAANGAHALPPGPLAKLEQRRRIEDLAVALQDRAARP